MTTHTPLSPAGVAGGWAEMRRDRFGPVPSSAWMRAAVGFVLLVLILGPALADDGRDGALAFAIAAVTWAVSAWATEKYIHKYPQRYYPYLFAAHLKAFAVHLGLLTVIALLTRLTTSPSQWPWGAVVLFAAADLLVSMPRRRLPDGSVPCAEDLLKEWRSEGGTLFGSLHAVDRDAALAAAAADQESHNFLKASLPFEPGDAVGLSWLEDRPVSSSDAAPSAVIVGRVRLNDVTHLDQYLRRCAEGLVEGGYAALKYEPLENVLRRISQRHSGLVYKLRYLAHFVWFRALPKIPGVASLYFGFGLDRVHAVLRPRRNRALARAEVWGRLAFWGLDVIFEESGSGDVWLLARAARPPAVGRKPSYYAVVGLEKVGLDGRPLRLHKVRTMFPFSEFLQKRVFEENGLAPSGKFANDFRLTEFGRFLRRFWVDELPQLWDWLRGDIKLVGIRATSRHFLSLYPPAFIRLYIQIKPGLVPPLFDSTVNSLDQIIAVEQDYLVRYWKNPFWTDARYLVGTIRDIVLRGVRSR